MAFDSAFRDAEPPCDLIVRQPLDAAQPENLPPLGGHPVDLVQHQLPQPVGVVGRGELLLHMFRVVEQVEPKPAPVVAIRTEVVGDFVSGERVEESFEIAGGSSASRLSQRRIKTFCVISSAWNPLSTTPRVKAWTPP